MPILSYIMAFALVAFSGPLLALAAADPVPGEIMLVIGPSASVQPAVITAAGGHLIGPELARFGALAQSDLAEFSHVLVEQGAWFVVDGRRIAAFCGVEI